MITHADIEEARRRILPAAQNMPLLRLPLADPQAEVWLKLENLSPIGSFKLRGVQGALARVSDEQVAAGIWTVSVGNFGRAVAWAARDLGVPATVVIPQDAPLVKGQGIEALGAVVERVTFDEMWSIMENGGDEARHGHYVDPVGFSGEMAGYGTIGLELAEQLSDIDTVLVPWGSGGLASGIAIALAAVQPQAAVFACEPESGAALAASVRVGHPQAVDYTSSFVDAAGGKDVLPKAWELAERVIAGTHVVSLDEAAAAIRYLALRAHVVAEGAGALPVAVALAGGFSGRTVCVVSGGNIDGSTLAEILSGTTPR